LPIARRVLIVWLKNSGIDLGEAAMTMKAFDDALATMDFKVSWEKGGIRHTDCRHAPRVNFWRDLLPPGLYETLAKQPDLGAIRLDFEPGRVLPLASVNSVHRVPQAAVERRRVPGIDIVPRYGRFYPRGILQGLPGVFRENMQPFRCTGLDAEGLSADLNHPLAGRKLALDVGITALRPKFEEHGGTSTDWLEAALEGPGMQARANGAPTDFFADDPFGRSDPRDDAEFYRSPRFVQHIDEAAIGVIGELHRRVIRPGAAVLDLMASWTSHLPAEIELGSLAVLGLNAEELQANPRAVERRVHDLNLRPELPFRDSRFDAVICTASVEYLTRPFEVFADVARVLKPGGVFLTSFSNRWFPPKAIRVWAELHEFERMGLVLEYFLRTGKYRALETFSMRGLPRPENDKYFGRIPYADPVFAVWGFKE
jgi:SAM-dependent methyltransferase